MERRSDAALQARWRKRWERFSGSSMTVAEFCRREGVSPATFYFWRRRLMQEDASAERRARTSPTRPGAAAWPGSRRGAFVEVGVASLAVVELQLPNGVQIRVPADREAALRAAIRAAGELASRSSTSPPEADAC